MVSAKLFHEEESKTNGTKFGVLLDEENGKFREEFLLDTSYPPRAKRNYCRKLLLPTIALFLLIIVSVIFYYRLNFETYTKLSKQDEFQDFNKFNKEIYGYYIQRSSLSQQNVFEENLKFIEECKRNNPGVNFTVNRFAYWGEDRIKAYLMNDMDWRMMTFAMATSDEEDFEVPDSFDWRNSKSQMITPIKDQGDCGSCWAFSIVAPIETQYAMKRGALLSLSEQELVDCDVLSLGCKGGYLNIALAFVHEKGLETDTDYPYVGYQHTQCLIQSEKIRVRIDKGYVLRDDEDFIANWVATKGPVSFMMPVTKSIMFYQSGIYNPPMAECQAQSVGFHAMAIVGFGREGNQKYWIVKNSWGRGWGDQGYLKMARGVNICGFRDYVYAPEIY